MYGELNQVQITGNLTREPELRYLADKRAVGSFTVAVTTSYKLPDGTFKETSAYIKCVAFGKIAERLGQEATKGTRVFVSGPIQTGSYKAKDGRTVYTTDVRADTLEILRQPSGQPSTNTMQHMEAKSNGYMPELPADEVDIAF